jgi:putative transcriptional regulator
MDAFDLKEAGSLITELKHTFLVATGELNGSVFERAVIYMVSHTKDGAMGFIINQPQANITFKDITQSMGIEKMMEARTAYAPTPISAPIIYKGGPVENNRGFVIHGNDYSKPSTVQVGPGVGLSTTSDIVADIATGKGPKDLNFCLGYAGWAPGQLEAELVDNGWLVVPADPAILFGTPSSDRYEAATKRLGIDALNFSDEIGMA